MRGGIYVLNFYSAVFGDQLKRGRKTATIRLGDKSSKYERGQLVWITIGFRHSPREKLFAAVIDDVEVKPLKELSRRDIEHDNPEFRRLDETQRFRIEAFARLAVELADLSPPEARRRACSARRFCCSSSLSSASRMRSSNPLRADERCPSYFSICEAVAGRPADPMPALYAAACSSMVGCFLLSRYEASQMVPMVAA